MRVGRLSFTQYFDDAAGAGAGTGTTTATTTTVADGGKDAAFWQAEAKKAFQDRDAVKNKLRDLEGRALTEEDKLLFDTLKVQNAKSEEERKRKEGEFDSWRADITKKHDEALKKEAQRVVHLRE